MPALQFSARPLPAELNPFIVRNFCTRRGASGVPLARQTFKRTTTWHVGCYDSRVYSLHTNSCLHFYPPSPSKRPYPSTPLCASTWRLLRSCSQTQESSLQRRLTLGLRSIQNWSKTRQYRYDAGSKYNSYRTDSANLFYRAAQLAFLGTFLAVYLALQSGSHARRTISKLQQAPPALTSTVESIQQHLAAVRKSIQKHLTYDHLSYRPREWPPSTLSQCAPYVGHIFAHKSASHLAVNSLSFYFLTSFLFPSMGVLTAATTFLAGGAIASQIDCAAAKAYANAWNPYHDIVAQLHTTPRDPNPNGTLGASRLGASAGLCTLFTVAAISSPFSRMSFMLVPVGIPVWMLWGGEVAWEGYSFYYNIDDGIGHGGHLAGHVAGVILWLVTLRWTRYGRMCRHVRWTERYDWAR